MLKCGDYTLDRAIGWGRSATYYAAFAGDDAGDTRLVVRCSRWTDRPHVQAFLRSAAEQQTAISSGCRRMAPVLDFGLTETGHAYRVNLSYEASLAECIQAGNAVDHDFLRSVVSGTLRALTELRNKCRRAHGNLTAGNILLDRDGEVLLTDLASTAQEATHSGDLHALGAIIYQLIRGSLRIGFLSPPLERSPEWSEVLEDHADDWRELTNRLLLTKKGEGAASLERAVKELKSLASLGERATVVPSIPHSGPSSGVIGGEASMPANAARAKRHGWKIAIAAILLAGGGITAALVLRKPPEAVIIEKPERLSARDLQKLIPLHAREKFGSGRTILDRLQEEARTPQEMWRLIALNWTVPARLKEIQEAWEAPPREWNELASELTTPADLPPEPSSVPEDEQDPRLTAALKDMERAMSVLAPAQAVERQWGRIEGTCKQLAEDKEARRAGFPDFAAWSSFAIGSSGTVEKGAQTANAVDAALRDLQKFLRDDGTRIHAKSMQTFSASIPNFQDAAFRQTGQPWPELWMAEAKKALRPRPSTLEAWDAKFKDIATRILARPRSEQAGLQKELEDLRTAAIDRLASQETDFEKQIQALRGKIRDPLEDLNEAFWAKVRAFGTKVKTAPDSETAKTHLPAFQQELRDLLALPEYQPVSAAFLARNNLSELAALFRPLEAAAGMLGKPEFNFRGILQNWERTDNADGTSTTLKARDAAGAELTFHMLPEGRSAMAAVETSLRLAALSGVAREAPREGALGYREANVPLPQKWLWAAGVNWERDMVRIGQRPETILPRHPDLINCPFTWVSARKAVECAQAFGARLPTIAEWTSAFGENRQTTARLRGGTFARAQKTIDTFSDERSTLLIPLDAGAFRFRPGGDSRIGVTNDAYPWFVPVIPSASDAAAFGKYAHLIGNAAEWILEPGGVPYVVGGSCLTDPGAAYTTPAPSNLTSTYSDVSFRMVVDVTPGSPNAALDAMKREVDVLLAKAPKN